VEQDAVVDDGGEAVEAPAERVGCSATRDKEAVVVNGGTAVKVHLEALLVFGAAVVNGDTPVEGHVEAV